MSRVRGLVEARNGELWSRVMRSDVGKERGIVVLPSSPRVTILFSLENSRCSKLVSVLFSIHSLFNGRLFSIKNKR